MLVTCRASATKKIRDRTEAPLLTSNSYTVEATYSLLGESKSTIAGIDARLLRGHHLRVGKDRNRGFTGNRARRYP